MNNKSSIYTDGTYQELFPTWHIEDSENKANEILRAIKVSNINPKTVAEIGCGAGEILKILQSKMSTDTTFKGYEISPQAFELCQSRVGNKLTFSNEDLLDKENKDFFDVVLCIDVFEHVENYYNFLRELKSKGTYKIFRIPLDLSARGVVKNTYWHSLKKYGHLHYYTKELILQVLEDLNYEIIDVHFDTILLNTKSPSIKSSIFKFFNKMAFKINQDLAARLFGGYFLIVTAK